MTTTPTSKAALESENRALRASLKEMLDCYWGDGDGFRPPEFIARAKRLISVVTKKTTERR